MKQEKNSFISNKKRKRNAAHNFREKKWKNFQIFKLKVLQFFRFCFVVEWFRIGFVKKIEFIYTSKGLHGFFILFMFVAFDQSIYILTSWPQLFISCEKKNLLFFLSFLQASLRVEHQINCKINIFFLIKSTKDRDWKIKCFCSLHVRKRVI